MSGSSERPNARRLRRTTLLFAVSVAALMVALSLAAALGGASTPSSRAPLAPSAMTRPIGATPSINAAVADALNAGAANALPSVSLASKRLAPSLMNETPDEILTSAGITPNVLPAINTAADYALSPEASSGLTTATFGSWGQYLEAFGEGCLTGGIIGYAGAAATSATAMTTVYESSAYAVQTVGTDTNPAVFALSCAIGGASSLIMFQDGLNEGQAAQVNYAGLWDQFSSAEWTAYYNDLNLTNAMYASLASLLGFAQVAFDRMADNAALLQVGDASFNSVQDLLQSGLALELSGMVADYNYQIGYDFANVPLWLDALTAQGAYYDGYGYILGSALPQTLGSYLMMPQTDEFLNASGGLPSNATASGLSISTTDLAGHFPVQFVFASLNTDVMYITVDSNVPEGPYSVHLSSPTPTGIPQRWFNFTAPVTGYPVAVGLPDGLYNLTLTDGGTTGHSDVSLLIPFAFQMPTPTSINVGAFSWMDRYFTEAGSVITEGYSTNTHGCEYSTPSTTGSSVEIGPWVNSLTSVTFMEYAAGGCDSGNGDGSSVQVTGTANWATVTSSGSGIPSFNAWSGSGGGISALIGFVMRNATLSAQTYWAFIRALGYTSLGSIPPDCIIPAPWQSLPSQVNLGAMTLNQTEALYEAWLKSMGDFYGANPSFHVCSGPVQYGWNWTTNFTFANLSNYEVGGVYLNNGTSPIAVTGKALPSEILATPSTWALPYATATSGGGETPVLKAGASANGTTSEVLQVPTTQIGYTGFLIVASAGAPPTLVSDYRGQTWAKWYSTTGDGGDLTIWVVNSSTVNDLNDTITVGSTTHGVASVSFYNGYGVVPFADFGTSGFVNPSGGYLLKASTTVPANAQLEEAVLSYGTVNYSAPSGGGLCVTSGASSYYALYRCDVTAGTGVVTARFGVGSVAWVDLVAFSILGTPSAQPATNATLFIVPTLAGVQIPLNSTWPIPASNPTWAFYTQKNASTGGWDVLNLIQMSGNGTSNGTSDHFGSATAGDALRIAICYENGTTVTSSCKISLSNWSLYLVGILSNNTVACPACCPTGETCFATGGTCGGGVFFFGSIVDWINDAWTKMWSSVPIVGGAIGSLGCGLAWLVGILVGLLLAILIVWVVIKLVGVGLSARKSAKKAKPKKEEA